MKIAIISPYITTLLSSEKYYNVQVFGLAEKLSELGCEIDIYTTKKDGDPNSKKISLKNNKKINVFYKKIIKIPFLTNIFLQPILIMNFNNINKKYDLIQVSEDFQFTTLLIATLRFFRIINIPIVISQGAYMYSSNVFFSLPWRLFDKIFGNLIRNNTDIVIAKTTAAKNFMRNKGYQQIKTIPVGINTNVFHPKNKKIFRDNIGLTNDIPLILYVGSLIPRRNLDVLIEAMPIVVKHLENVMLILIGEGILEKSIKDKIRIMNLEKHIRLFPKILNKKLPYVYSSADVFVFLSKEEIFGMVLLESMSCGTPVISTQIPFAKDIIANNINGIILENIEKETLAKHIIAIIENKDLNTTIKEKAKETIKKNYQWDDLANEFFQIYQYACSQNKQL